MLHFHHRRPVSASVYAHTLVLLLETFVYGYSLGTLTRIDERRRNFCRVYKSGIGHPLLHGPKVRSVDVCDLVFASVILFVLFPVRLIISELVINFILTLEELSDICLVFFRQWGCGMFHFEPFYCCRYFIPRVPLVGILVQLLENEALTDGLHPPRWCPLWT